MKSVQTLLSRITEVLSSNPKREESIQQAMQLLLEHSRVCRVYFFELVPNADYAYMASQLFEVCAPGVEQQIDNPELQQVPMLPYFEHWLHTFQKNEAYYGDVSRFPDGEREILESQGIVSIIVLPVYWDQKLVGFIGFDETKAERNWTDEDVTLLRESSQLLGRLLAAHSVDLALEQKNTEFGQLVDVMPIAFMELDASRNIISWNTAAERIFGYEEADVLGQPIEMVAGCGELFSNNFHDDSVVSGSAQPSDSDRDSQSLHDSVRIMNCKKKNGEPVPVRWRVRVLTNEFKKVTRYILLAEDITAELRQSEALREREELFRNLYERMNDGVVYQDETGKIIRGNQAACRLLGLSMDQLLGRESFDPRWRATKDNGEPFPGEEHPAMVALREGTQIENVIMGVYNPMEEHTRWISINATPEFREGESKPYRVFTLFRDVTDSIEMRNKLIQQQQKFLAYASSLSVGVWFRDADYNLTFVNEALAGIFGITKEDFYLNDGEKYLDFIHPDDRDLVAGKHRLHIEKKQDVELEWRLLRADGQERWVHVKLIYIETPASEVPTSAGYMTDITEQKIKMETLASAKTTAESLSKLRMGIIEAISHEFRTPITSIMGFTTLIQEMLEDKEMLQFASMVHDSADRLYRTLESILSYSALISQQATIRPRKFEIGVSLSALMENITNQTEEKGLYFQKFIPDNLMIHGDETVIHSIVQQLLDNAVKFTKKGGIRLHIKAIGNKLYIEIIDTGIGIPENLSLSVFEPFRQGSEGDSRLYDGAGMGLPIVLKQVELLKGVMEHKNNEFGGCTFNITIPLELEPEVAKVQIDRPPVERDSDLRILYVEDNPVLQLMMKKSLPEFSIICVSSPDEAFAKLEEDSYHVFMIDINLNDNLTGIDVCQAIRKHPKQSGSFIMAVTAQSKDKLDPFMGPDGFNAYFAKPFNHNNLKQAIRQHYGLETTGD